MDVDSLLSPTSIAVVGASDRPSPGRSILASLTAMGFGQAVYPVNPKYDQLLGYRCYPSLDETPKAPDAVALCVGGSVMENLERAAKRGVRGAVIYGGGFAEHGEDGRALQQRITGICREAGMALCGPNCMGILNPRNRSSLYLQEIVDSKRLVGNVGLISQSGSVCIGMLADLRRFGFSHLISSGNEAVTTLADYMEALVDDGHTRVIGLFVETIRQPDRFVAALDRAAARGKPVVVLKVGRSARTAQAITSHTGGLAGSSRVFSQVLREHRAIEVDDLDVFTEVLAACQGRLLPQDGGLGVVTGSGGQAELILDIAMSSGINVPPLPASLRGECEQFFGSVLGDGNPLDAWGSGNFAANFPYALSVLDRANTCANIALCVDAADGQPMLRKERYLDYVELLAKAASNSSKPHFALGTRSGVMMTAQVDHLSRHGVALVSGTRQGLTAIDKLARWSRSMPPARMGTLLAGGLATLGPLSARRSVNEVDAKAIFAAQGLPVALEATVATVGEGLQFANKIGYPVVLKAVSDDIAHKSDFGLVMVGVRNEQEFIAAYSELKRRIESVARHGKVLGVLVQQMVEDGIEVFAGVKRDPEFGLVLAFGLGGVAVEILDDVSLAMLPLGEGRAEAMIREIKGLPLLQGARGKPTADIEALARCLQDFADYAWADREHISEIDLNPIIVLERGKGCRIVDALIVPNH
jgi:acetate---CoA ligase (ADP-forming)